MKIVLDTNVLVSGLLSPFGTPGEIVRMAVAGVIQLVYDSRIISEYKEVLLRPKFKFNKDNVEAILDQIIYCGENALSEPLKERLADKDDEMFLEVAISSKVKYLVTGNIKHFPANKRECVEVVTPNEFIEEYRKQI